MNSSIPYSGFSAVPSDYDVNDGELSLSLNLIHEDGALRPVSPPVEVLALRPDETLLVIHEVPGQKNYILARQPLDGAGQVDILWLKQSDDVTDTASASFIASYGAIRDIASLGNTLVIASDTGLVYLLWKDDSYRQLGSRPPFVSIDFGLYRVASLSDSGTFSIPSNCALNGRHGAATDADWAYFTQVAYGLLLPSIASNVTANGLFYQPFFIRYAYRLYDGSYSWHSAPVLMLPTVLPPFILYSEGESSGDITTIGLALSVPYFALAYRIISDGIDELADWHDIVAGIDIFVSAPIYTYDQSQDVGRATTMNALLSSLTPDKVPASNDGGNNSGSPGRPGGVEIASPQVFVGHYADGVDNAYTDHSMCIDNEGSHLVDIRRHEKFVDNIRDCHTFYKLAEIDFDSIKAMDSMAPLPIADRDLSALVARPTLSDDYQSHCGLAPSSLYAFNSRLNLAGVEISPAPPFPIRSVMQFGNPNAETSFAAHPRITVWSRLNGVGCYAIRDSLGASMADVWFDPANNFPRYIFYPDASAYLMEIYISPSQRYLLKLTPHDFLNGAYFFLGDAALGVSPLPDSDDVSVQPPASAISSVSEGSKIYTSEVNNPFVFPLSGINTVGSGRIMALSSAAKALSQGQFGQFPLYAFTSDGVWALETTATGSYSAKQPITRDVCVNPQSIKQLDTAVLFATVRGVMLLSGSQASCISDAINSDSPFDAIQSLPRFSDLMAAHTSEVSIDSCLPTLPFSQFLGGCRMIYDYPHQRIILFNPSVTYAYLYSLKSKSWGMTHSDIVSGVPSYPNALAIRHDPSGRSVVDFSITASHAPGGVLLSRPLKLNAPDTLKTIDSVIQRGNFRKGHVQSVLYGSRDLYHWHLVWSSKDHFLRGFRGSPYKYFRLALLCSLSPDESLSGASIQFTPRLTNQPR